MELRLWRNFSKKAKSTMIPNRAADLVFDVVLKEDTTIESPSFLLDNIPLDVTYAYFEGRYYFKEDIRRGITGQYELLLVTDHAATYRNIIGNSQFFVERASHTYDVNINDSYLSQKQTYQKDFAKFNPFDNDDYISNTTGSYVVRMIGADDDLASASTLWNPGVTTLLMYGTELASGLDFLFKDSNFSDVITDAIVKAFFNPFQYILSIKWVPINHNKYGTAHPNLNQFHKMQSGWWAPTKTIGGITDNVRGILLEGYDVIRKKIPMMARRYNDFRDFNANWTKIKCFAPFVGNFEIDPVDYYSNSLYAVYKLDLISNKALFMIEYSNDNTAKVIFQHSFDFGVDLQIGQNSSNVAQVIGDVASMAGNAYAGNFVAAAASGVDAVANVIQPTPSYKGQPSTRVAYDTLEFGIIRYTADSAEFMTEYSGRPLYQKKRIADIPGYIQCSGAEIDLPGSSIDRDAVNALLNGGFYYE